MNTGEEKEVVVPHPCEVSELFLSEQIAVNLAGVHRRQRQHRKTEES